MAAESKHCCECQQRKPLSEFHRSEKHGGRAPRCKPCAIEVAARWYRENKDRKRAYDAKRREEKRQLFRDASRRFRRSNPGAKNADTQARRAALRGAVPAWANLRAIALVYRMAALKTAETGIKHVVDHEIPLRGKVVCGLHVETNLLVIEEAANLRKSNHYSIGHGGRK